MNNWLYRIMAPDDRSLDPVTEPGSGIKDEKMLKMVDGVYELVKIGQSNLYDQIQSHRDSVDIYKILERYAAGDLDVLEQAHGQYIDITNAPKTLAEAYTYIENSKKYFENLPLKVREEYDHDASKFVADIGSEHFNKLFEELYSQNDPPKNDPPANDPPKNDPSVKEGNINA